ncbi:MAG: acetoacetate decarboxylase family protein [Ruminococcaceae bacterium]|nr:acetoacetate decarboxylase family protein [Oscillospiraceae bacterium]
MSQNISFVKTPEEVAASRTTRAIYAHKKVLSFSWTIDDAVYRKLLPPGLDPLVPRVTGFVAMFPFAGAGLAPYMEGAIFLTCAKDGVPGGFCLAMPVDGPNEMGIYLGREMYGYPKKVSNITMRRQGDSIYGSIERNGIKYFEIKAMVGTPNHPDYATLMPKPELENPFTTYSYLLNYKMECVGLDKAPTEVLTYNNIRMFRQRNDNISHSFDYCNIEVNFEASESDPWIELAPKEIIGGNYQVTTGEMLGTQLVHEYTGAEVEAITPYLFLGYDVNMVGKNLEFFP